MLREFSPCLEKAPRFPRIARRSGVRETIGRIDEAAVGRFSWRGLRSDKVNARASSGRRGGTGEQAAGQIFVVGASEAADRARSQAGEGGSLVAVRRRVLNEELKLATSGRGRRIDSYG